MISSSGEKQQISKLFNLLYKLRVNQIRQIRYDFEKDEINNENYFEWIVNVINPVGRKRYNRVLVRGITGETGIADVAALQQSVNARKTDIDWLITNRRVSRAAKDEVSKQENLDLFCYTLDELLDRDADFSGYLNWLEDEIKQRGIDCTYVPLARGKGNSHMSHRTFPRS